MRDNTVTVESRFDPSLAQALLRKGHNLRMDLDTGSFGRGQMIVRLDNGVLVGGTESRTDSNIACW
jgi:gamma-glutamyltranspeptidase/glutathione hydrolase